MATGLSRKPSRRNHEFSFHLISSSPFGVFLCVSCFSCTWNSDKVPGKLGGASAGDTDVSELHQTGCCNGIRFKGVRTLLCPRSRSCTMRQATAQIHPSEPDLIPDLCSQIFPSDSSSEFSNQISSCHPPNKLQPQHLYLTIESDGRGKRRQLSLTTRQVAALALFSWST